MNLFRKHKKFEEQINEQLGDIEAKPSSSLWNRIDENLANDSFETDVKDRLENFEPIPSPASWDKIELELPSEKINIRFLRQYIIAVFALFFASGLYILNKIEVKQVSKDEFQSVSNQQIITENNSQQNEPKTVSSPNKAELIHATKNNIKSKNPNKFSSNQLVQKNSINGNSLVLTNRIKQNKLVNNSHSYSNTLASNKKTNTSIPITMEEITINDNRPQTSITNSINNIALPNDNQEIANTIIDSTNLYAIESAIPAREVSEAKPDSTLLAQQIAAYTKKPNEDELSKFSISILAGVHLSFTTYSAPKESTLNFEDNIAFRKQLERTTIDWAGGFMLDYRLNQKWMLSSGIMMVNFNQEFDYDVTPATTPANPSEIGAPISSPQDSILIGNQYSNRIRYTWTEIPLFINYTIKKGVRWDIDIQGGLSYAFINTIDGGMVSYDNKGVLVLRDKESFPQISNALFITAMPQLSYKFGKALSIGVVPTGKYSLTSIIGNKNWIQQHPYFIGLNICLRKRF